MDLFFLLPVLAWGLVVGVVFSAIGAAGGILTSFGLITLFGVADPNSVKPMTQLVVLSTALTFAPAYFRHSAVVLPLGLALGAAGLLGAYTGSTLSSVYLADMHVFRPVFGALTLAIAVQLLWSLIRQRRHPGPEHVPSQDDDRVSDVALSRTAISFHCAGRDTRVPLWSPLAAGFAISMTASVFGVGGGFLLVPYMASMLGMPMHVIPATAAIAIFMSLVVSIGNFLALGAPVDWPLLWTMIPGAVIGAILGPRINRALGNRFLHAIMAFIVLGIGLKYSFL